MRVGLKAVWVVIPVLLVSCYKPGKIKVQNNINSVAIESVEWGDVYLAGELFPGESTDFIELDKSDVTLPGSHSVSFTMRANNRSVFLITNQSYSLDEDEELVIQLDDSTAVYNPNS